MMVMSLSIPTLKFLLDENVRIELFRYLKAKSFTVKLLPKSTSDSKLANLSKVERFIIVTNDEDFTDYSKNEIFSIIWLRVPQSDPQTLISSFEKLIKECKNFAGKLITLIPDDWDESSLND